MSVDLWNWKPICDTRPCPGECDLCGYPDEEDEEPYVPYEIKAEVIG